MAPMLLFFVGAMMLFIVIVGGVSVEDALFRQRQAKEDKSRAEHAVTVPAE